MGDDQHSRWMRDAVCRGLDPDMFMPERGDQHKIRAAKALCKTCPVNEQCREYGLELHQRTDLYGIFGGLTRHERDMMLRNRRTIKREPFRP